MSSMTSFFMNADLSAVTGASLLLLCVSGHRKYDDRASTNSEAPVRPTNGQSERREPVKTAFQTYRKREQTELLHTTLPVTYSRTGPWSGFAGSSDTTVDIIFRSAVKGY